MTDQEKSKVLDDKYLKEMYYQGLRMPKMKEKIEAEFGKTIPLADLRRLFNILDLDLRKKPTQERWGVKIGDTVYYDLEEAEVKTTDIPTSPVVEDGLTEPTQAPTPENDPASTLEF